MAEYTHIINKILNKIVTFTLTFTLTTCPLTCWQLYASRNKESTFLHFIVYRGLSNIMLY